MSAPSRESLAQAAKRAINDGPARQFDESIDMTVVLRNLDLKRDPKARFSEIIELAHSPREKGARIAVIGQDEFALRAKEAGADTILGVQEVEGSTKKALKRLANEHEFFVAQADLLSGMMRRIGPIFGPRNKIPIPLPVSRLDELPSLIERLKRSERANMRDQPLFHLKIGFGGMSPEEIAENADRVLEELKRKYGTLSRYLKAIYMKSTMGPAIRVGLGE